MGNGIEFVEVDVVVEVDIVVEEHDTIASYVARFVST